MKKKLVMIIILLLIAYCRSVADVSFVWGTGIDGVIKDDSGDLLEPFESTPYGGNGCFLQLILANHGDIHYAMDSGTGVSGGDEVIATSWLGRPFFVTGGEFAATFNHDLPPGTPLYMRAWNAPSTNYDGGATDTNASVPTGPLTKYGNSVIYVTTADPSASPPLVEQFRLDDVGESFSTVLVPIPEPSTICLLALGLLTIGVRRKLLK